MRGHMQRQENEVVGLLQLQALAAKYAKEGTTPDWPVITKTVSRTQPPYAGYLKSLISFEAAKSGGADGEHLLHLQAVRPVWVNPKSRSSLPPLIYEAFAGFQPFFLSLALWQAAYVCPKDDVKNKVCMWL